MNHTLTESFLMILESSEFDNGGLEIKNSFFSDIKQDLREEWEPETPFPLISIINLDQNITFLNVSFEKISSSFKK